MGCTIQCTADGGRLEEVRGGGLEGPRGTLQRKLLRKGNECVGQDEGSISSKMCVYGEKERRNGKRAMRDCGVKT